MGPQNSKKQVWIALIVGLVIGFLVGVAAFYERDEEPEMIDEEREDLALNGNATALSADDDRKALETESVFVESELVHIKDQSAGNTVFISRVELKGSGWVAIHDDIEDAPGSILGAQRFDAGVYQGTVNLLRPTEVGDTYHATLWRDNGDNEFDHTQDILLPLEENMSFEAF